MPKHVHIRIQPKPVKPRRSMLPRDVVAESATKFVHAMQYYWLFGLSDARTSRCDATGAILIDAVAIDDRVLRVASRPPMDFEVEQVHLLWSCEGLQKLSEGKWDVVFGSLSRPIHAWTDESARFEPASGDRLVLYADEHGHGSPFRVVKTSGAARPEELPYVPVYTLKGLKPVRFSLWRWYTASYALACFSKGWHRFVPSGSAQGSEDPEEAMGVALHEYVFQWQLDVAREVADALKQEVIVLPQYWCLRKDASPELREGEYDGAWTVKPGEVRRVPEIGMVEERLVVRQVLRSLGVLDHDEEGPSLKA